MRKRFLSVAFLLALALLALGIFAGCENCVHEYGEWETLSAATCEKKGEKERVCKKCGRVETEDIAALEHVFDEKFTIDVEPTAESEGIRSRHCLHEGCSARVDEQKIAKLSEETEEPQTPEVEQPKPQNPQNPNENEEPEPGTPQNPDKDEEQTPQNPNEDEEQTPQNPQNPNENEESEPQTPQNPEKDEEQEPHTPQNPDKEEKPKPQTPQNPNKDKEQESQTPQNPNKEEEKESQTPQKPNEDEEPQTPQPPKPAPKLGDVITYRVYVNRWNGFKFYYDSPKISIYDSEEKQVFSDFIGIRQSVVLTNEEEYYMRDIPLPMGDYTIRIDHVTKGFVYEDSYKMSYLDGTSPYDTEDKYPTVDIRLGCDMNQGGEMIDVGQVVRDFTFPTLNKGTVTLRELLKIYDLLIINVYDNRCIYCIEEAPILRKIMENYEKIGFVFIDDIDNKEKTLSGIQDTFGFELDRVYLVCEKEAHILYKIKDVTGVPRNFFIDKEGFVARKTGGVTEEWVERIIRLNMIESREAHGKLYSPAEKEEPAALCSVPEADISKRRY